MKHHKRPFSLWVNWRYAFAGLGEVARHEAAFRIELWTVGVMILWASLLPIPLEHRMILILSLFVPLIVEMINSAIERVVDLVTLEENEMAKRAKDAASAAVLLSLLATGAVWMAIFYLDWEQIVLWLS
ncbi:MAG: diacylglycerol kinase [Campylobacterales bacterium]